MPANLYTSYTSMLCIGKARFFRGRSGEVSEGLVV